MASCIAESAWTLSRGRLQWQLKWSWWQARNQSIHLGCMAIPGFVACAINCAFSQITRGWRARFQFAISITHWMRTSTWVGERACFVVLKASIEMWFESRWAFKSVLIDLVLESNWVDWHFFLSWMVLIFCHSIAKCTNSFLLIYTIFLEVAFRLSGHCCESEQNH